MFICFEVVGWFGVVVGICVWCVWLVVRVCIEKFVGVEVFGLVLGGVWGEVFCVVVVWVGLFGFEVLYEVV